LVNGNPYLDPEGKIIKYGYSSLTCEVTYMIEKPTGNVIKYVVPVANNEPIKLATAKVYNNEYVIKTVTGKEMTARNIVLMQKGFLAYREGASFAYKPGEGIVSLMIPDKFHIAAFQNGEVGDTNLILLEMDEDTQNLVTAFKSVGSSLGLNKKRITYFLTLQMVVLIL